MSDTDRADANPRDILITGFPTFLARKLLETILEREPNATIRLLIMPNLMDRAQKRLEEIDFDPDRVEVLEGDVVAIDLGLSGTEYLDIVANVTDIYHIASIWYLGADREELFEVNVRGARNVLDTAREAKNLSRLNHLSTAFVSGDRTGVIMEGELNEGQNFRNAYEETKFEAELAMRDAMSEVPISVFRPTIVVGDSTTGEIDRMAGPYYLLNAIVQMPPGVPILMPGKGDFPLNMVPADFVSEAMHTISRQAETAGQTFHLCDPNPLSARKVFELVADQAGKSAPVGRMPYKLTKWVMKFPYLEKLTRSPRQFLDDVNQLTLYNGMHTAQALRSDQHCPPFPEYVPKLVDFIRQSESTFDFDMPPLAGVFGGPL
jgi:thioester reductase-like protein